MWISSAVVPLVQFANCVRPLSSTQLDLAGLGLVFPSRLAEKLREFDEVVSWYGSNRAEFREAMTAVHPCCTFLPALPDVKWQEPATDFFLQQVSAPAGLIPRIIVQANNPRGSAVIHPFSGGARKNWPLGKYRELAARLPVPVEWAAGPEEKLDGATRFDNLLDLARWMAGAAAYVGNDSGISHLAAAIGLPSVVLFGPTNPTVWRPNGDSVKVLHSDGWSNMAVERVHEAVTSLLSMSSS